MSSPQEPPRAVEAPGDRHGAPVMGRGPTFGPVPSSGVRASAKGGNSGERSRLVVSEGGLEPPRPCGHQPLKLARLPIPPLRRGRRSYRGRLGERPATKEGRPATTRSGQRRGGTAGGHGWGVWLVGGTRSAQLCASHRREGPSGFGETPAVSSDHARRLGSVKSGRATICCQSAVSTSE